MLFFFRFMYEKIHQLYEHDQLKSYRRPMNVWNCYYKIKFIYLSVKYIFLPILIRSVIIISILKLNTHITYNLIPLLKFTNYKKADINMFVWPLNIISPWSMNISLHCLQLHDLAIANNRNLDLQSWYGMQ